MELLHESIDFSNVQIDPAPFQLVEQTSLYKVSRNLITIHEICQMSSNETNCFEVKMTFFNTDEPIHVWCM